MIDTTKCCVCGGEFSADRVIIDGGQYHPRCSIMSYDSHTHEDMAEATNLIWKLRTVLQVLVARNDDKIAATALHDLFPTDRERDQHFIALYKR